MEPIKIQNFRAIYFKPRHLRALFVRFQHLHDRTKLANFQPEHQKLLGHFFSPDAAPAGRNPHHDAI